MDKSGAVNLMLYANSVRGTKDIGATWDVWSSQSISALSNAVEPTATPASCRMGQPIISELSYITPEASARAFASTGIPRWTFVQYPGDMAIVPPSLPHQVCLHCLNHRKVLNLSRFQTGAIRSRSPVISSHLLTFPFSKTLKCAFVR